MEGDRVVEARENTGEEGGGKRDLSDGGKGGGRTRYRKWEAVTLLHHYTHLTPSIPGMTNN